MIKINKPVIILSALMLGLAGCGGDNDKNPVVNAAVDPIHLKGYYEGLTVLDGYSISSEIGVDPQGDFIGVAYNKRANVDPKVVFTVIKGNVNNSILHEFDLTDSSINIYKAKGHQRTDNDIVFKFSAIPSDLKRPTSLLVTRRQPKGYAMNNLIGTRNGTIIDLQGSVTGVLDIRATNTPAVLSLNYTGTNEDCQLTGVIQKQPYQHDFVDFTGTFKGAKCFYAGRAVKGLVGYNTSSDDVIMYGATLDNSNGFVILPRD